MIHNDVNRDDARPIDDEKLDRLVDGELNETERRELLSGLDRVPEGWRRCALAFLEAQAWRGLMGDLVRSPVPPAPPPAEEIPSPADELPRPAARRHLVDRWPLTLSGTGVAMAASVMIAVLSTSLAKDWYNAYHGGAKPGPGILAGEAKRPEPQRAPLARPGLEANGGVQMVTLPVNTGGPGPVRNIQLPCLEGNSLDVDRLSRQPASLPPEMLEALERSGYEIRQHRQLLPLQLNDGRRVVVPIDQFEVGYGADRAN